MLQQLCAELNQAGAEEADVISLGLNITASDRGLFPPGFGELRFRSGTRWRHTLREWYAVGREAERDSLDYLEAITVARDANLNFEDCKTDLGAIAPDVEGAVCYDPETLVTGPGDGLCAALDSPCGRGVLDGSGCCNLAPRALGTPCDGGLCDGNGACVPHPRRPRHGSQSAAWIESIAGLQDVAAWYASDGFEVRVDEQPRLLFAAGPPAAFSEVHIATAPQLPFDVVGAHVALDEDVALVLHPKTGRSEICLAPGPLDRLGTLLPDCSSPGALHLECPGAVGEFACEVRDGAFVVRGPELRLAWERYEAADRDVHTLIFPGGCIDLGEGRCVRPGCKPPCLLVRPCSTRCGRLAFQRCNPFGCPGPCAHPQETEQCDGLDNDCDGPVDEGTHVLCDDGVPCTVDRCLGGRCDNREWDFLCTDGSACSIDRCLSHPDPEDERDTVVPPDANGCTYELRDSWCEDSFDGCDCNGQERCVPGTSTHGCVTPPRWNPSTGTAHAPCEDDRNNCTFEPCCERNLERCRYFRLLPEEDQDEVRRLCDLAPGDEVVSETGRRVSCVSGPTGEVECADDGNPCTFASCIPDTGACEQTAQPDGRRPPGCNAVLNRGCAQQECQEGACTLVSALDHPDDPDPEACSGSVYCRVDEFLVPSCAKWSCERGGDDFDCVQRRDDRRPCNDGVWCNGPESCDLPVDCSVFLGHWGCTPGEEPCKEASCLEGICIEETMSCDWIPHHERCPGNAGIDDACDYEYRCSIDANLSHQRCAPVPPGGICDDEDACTLDECRTNEFGTAECNYSLNPECIDLDPIEPPGP